MGFGEPGTHPIAPFLLAGRILRVAAVEVIGEFGEADGNVFMPHEHAVGYDEAGWCEIPYCA